MPETKNQTQTQTQPKIEGVRIEGRGLDKKLERDVTLALDYIDRLGIRVATTNDGWVVIKIGGHIERMYLKPAEAIALALRLIAAAMTERERAGTA